MPDTLTQIHTFNQPIETTVKVGIEVDSKGQKKPSVEVKITRKVEQNEKDKSYELIMNDLYLALSKCKEALKSVNEV